MITKEEVREFLHRFEQLASEKDFGLIENLVHEDAFFRFNDGDFRGRAAVRQVFQKTWDSSSSIVGEKYYLNDIEVLSADQKSATATYTYNWEGQVEDQSFSIKGRGTRVLVKVNGSLQIIHEHLSRFPE